MEKGEYKKVLSEIFDVLGFSEFEKEKATESFKKKLISDLFQSLKDKLPEDQQEWIKGQDKNTNPQDSHIPQIQETIKKAQALGYKYYDFWGIDEKKWPGVTRFKKGYGGFEVNYGDTYDLTLNKFWYTLYKLVKSFR